MWVSPNRGVPPIKRGNFEGKNWRVSLIGNEKLRTVFVFEIARLEGPPQAYAFFTMGISMGKSSIHHSDSKKRTFKLNLCPPWHTF